MLDGRIEVRATDDEKAMMRRAADATGRSLSDFVRRAARVEAVAVLAAADVADDGDGDDE